MRGTAPVATLEAAPSGQSLDSGTADDPTDDDRIIASPVDGHLGKLYVNTSGELGVKLSRRGPGHRRLLPWDSGATEGKFLFRDSPWPAEGWPLGFQADEGEEFRIDFRNRSGAELQVEAAITVVPRWGSAAVDLELRDDIRELVEVLSER